MKKNKPTPIQELQRKPKSANNSTPAKDGKKPRFKFRGEVYDYSLKKHVPVGDSFIENFCEDYLAWADQKDAISNLQFLNSKNIVQGTFDRLRKDCPELQEAHKLVMQKIAMRREAGLMNKEFSEKSTMFMQPLYDKRWVKLARLQEEIKNVSGGDGSTSINVVMPAFPNSDLVPRKIEEEE